MRIHPWQRSAACATKDSNRPVMPNRTGGWQFALDGRTGEVLGAYEHVNNECNSDKHMLLMEVLGMR